MSSPRKRTAETIASVPRPVSHLPCRLANLFSLLSVADPSIITVPKLPLFGILLTGSAAFTAVALAGFWFSGRVAGGRAVYLRVRLRQGITKSSYSILISCH